MNTKVKTKELQNALETLVNDGNFKGTEKGIRLVIISAVANGVEITAFDFEKNVKIGNTYIPAESVKYGMVAVDAAPLWEIIHKFGRDTVQIRTGEREEFIVSFGKANFSLLDELKNPDIVSRIKDMNTGK